MKQKKNLTYSPNTFQSYGEKEINAVKQFLSNNDFNDEKIIEKFEERVASLFGMKYGIFVNSGSSANLLACLALGIGPDDEVITPTCTFPTTLSPLIFLGSQVIFSDICEGHYVPSVEQILSLITPKTTVILIPDLVGDKFDFAKLREELKKINRSDIKLIEDACDTFTTSVADFATVSFYASHIINAGGCGGMTLTNDPNYAQKCKELRRNSTWDLSCPSYCAAFGYENSLKIEEFAAARHKNLLHYHERLKGSQFFELPENKEAVWLSMALLVKSNRFEIVEHLEEIGIQTRLCMAGNILRQPFYSHLFPNIDPEGFPVTEKAFSRGILIGLHQGLSDEDIDWICDRLLELAEKYSVQE
ncbi:DegT/DnrJ/EryC1/StrS aminotransferase family protein [Histomonas meleagridis]|uniref:DegT/DnrJ/EryC1/StrS aminotransferase family protein n=1 Tax=Histomonas meleagridis TaxID=135588 RepID=UPI003559DBA5|nr:DegT/DnrJ/EryC1/StrS aminotransferase family protein [Histomonas meleagridis]KAH0796228.1 DegT/DnrJ/EryC1/StrS aminotransferase family protein [Histomonas meleagridis]